MKTITTCLAATLALAAHGLAQAGPTLNDARAGINAGTWPGITVLGVRPGPQAASAASAAPAPRAAGAALATAPQATRPAAPQAAPPSPGGRSGAATGLAIGWGGPLTHRSMRAATRLDGPSIGIALPSAATAASAASARP